MYIFEEITRRYKWHKIVIIITTSENKFKVKMQVVNIYQYCSKVVPLSTVATPLMWLIFSAATMNAFISPSSQIDSGFSIDTSISPRMLVRIHLSNVTAISWQMGWSC